MRTQRSSVFHRVRTKYVMFTLVVALVLIGLWFWAAGPVLLSFRNGPMGGDTQIIIFNPLRNRAPEQAAEFFLESLKTGRCQEIMPAAIDNSPSRQAICSLETEHPLTAWRFRDREDKAGQTTLSYWYRRKDSEGEERLFIWLEMKNEQWRVISYKRNY